MSYPRNLAVRAARSPAVYTIVGVVILGATLARWVASIGGPAAFRESYGAAAPLATAPIHVVLSITPFPSDVVSIANGALYGFTSGAILSWLAWWVAAVAEFGLGRRARKDFDLESQLDRMPTWLKRFPVDHPVFLIGGRQVPYLGGHLTSFVPGAAGVRFSRYVWCSAVAVLPGAIVMAGIGAGLMKI
jgi:uncharacterized membrane protein YdjX (TVP38/TMEM64 family)